MHLHQKGTLVMLILTIFVIGLMLGLRFKVFILVPAIGLTFAVVVVNANAEDGVWRLVGTMVLAAIFLQLGYVGASALQFVIDASRAAVRRGALTRRSTKVPQPGQWGNHGGASSRFETNKQLRQA
jgi:hypothetical protein